MKNSFKLIAVIVLLLLVATAVPEHAFAAGTSCYGSLDADTPPLPGQFITCMLSSFWLFGRSIFIAIAFIMTMYLVYKTVRNRENSKVLETLPTQWMYLIIFFFLAFGAGGIILNFLFKLFGFGPLEGWILPVNDILHGWDSLIR